MNLILRDALRFLRPDRDDARTAGHMVVPLTHSQRFFFSLAPILWTGFSCSMTPDLLRLLLRADTIIWARDISFCDFNTAEDMKLVEEELLPRLVSPAHISFVFSEGPSDDFVSRVLYPIASLDTISMSLRGPKTAAAVIRHRMDLLQHPTRESIRKGACGHSIGTMIKRLFKLTTHFAARDLVFDKIVPCIVDGILMRPVSNMETWSQAVFALAGIAEYLPLTVEMATQWLDICHRLYGESASFTEIRWAVTWFLFMLCKVRQPGDVLRATVSHAVFQENLEIFLKHLDNLESAITDMIAVNVLDNFGRALVEVCNADVERLSLLQKQSILQPLVVKDKLFQRVQRALEFLHSRFDQVEEASARNARRWCRPLADDALVARRSLWSLAYGLCSQVKALVVLTSSEAAESEAATAETAATTETAAETKSPAELLLVDLGKKVAPIVNRSLRKLRIKFTLPDNLRLLGHRPNGANGVNLGTLPIQVHVYDSVQPFHSSARSNGGGSATLFKLGMVELNQRGGECTFSFEYEPLFPIVQLLFEFCTHNYSASSELFYPGISADCYPVATALFDFCDTFDAHGKRGTEEYCTGDGTKRDQHSWIVSLALADTGRAAECLARWGCDKVSGSVKLAITELIPIESDDL